MTTSKSRFLLLAAAFLLGCLCGALVMRQAGDGGRPATVQSQPAPAAENEAKPIGTFFQVFGGQFY